MAHCRITSVIGKGGLYYAFEGGYKMDSLHLNRILPVVLPATLLSFFLVSCGSNNPQTVNTYSVGGTVSGLSGTLVLQNNGGNNFTRTANGSFTFSTRVTSGSSYNVTVLSQPSGQTCTVTNGSGTIQSSNVTNVLISCTDSYSVGGTVSGLSGTMVLQNNGTDDLTVTTNGAFSFNTALANGTAYSVTVLSQPLVQTCTVTNGSGVIDASDVTNVQITCVNNTMSGKITVPSGVLIDSDVNDVLESYISNDTFDTAQVLPNPISLGGYVNEVGAGAAGRSTFSGDLNDCFQVPLKADDTITLFIGKADTVANDLDLYLYDTSGVLIDGSMGTGSYEKITVPADEDYIVVVSVSSGASNYILTIGANTAAGAGAKADAGILAISHEFVPGQVIVRFKETVQDTISSNQDPVARAAAMGMELTAGAPGREMLMTFDDSNSQAVVSQTQGTSKRLSQQSGMDYSDMVRKVNTINVIKALRKRADILSAEPNYILHHYSTEPDDTYYWLQWHYPLIYLPEAWDYTIGDNNVIVAVIDTGVLLGHPDLGNRLTNTGYDFIRDPLTSNDGDGIDANPNDPGDAVTGSSSFHGTHCAGIIGAETDNALGMAGVTWNTRIMPIRVLGVGGGTVYDIMQGIRYAAGLDNDSGTTPAQAADILSMSLGGGSYLTAEQALIDEVRAEDIVVIAAAGNENTSTLDYPASYNGVISVSAVNISGTKASYSNFGSEIDIAAPGGDGGDINGDGYADGVWSTCGDDSSGTVVYNYRSLSGTSMAAPHVAGVVALMKALYPNLSADELDALISNGSITNDIGSGGRDDFYGYGLINALKAVAAAENASSGMEITGLNVEPKSVNFGTSGTGTLLTVSKLGTGVLSVTGVSDDADWLTVTETSVDSDGFGTYTLHTDRSGLTQEGTYIATVVFTASSGVSISVHVTLQVSTMSVTYDAGYHYVLLIRVNADNTFNIVDQYNVDISNGYYSYAFTNVLRGTYFIIAGSDRDNDGYIDNPGESLGAYPSLDQPIYVDTSGNLSGLDFQTDFKFSIYTSGLSIDPNSALPRFKRLR